MESKVKDARVEGRQLRTRGKSSEVLQWQGLRIKTQGREAHSGVAIARPRALSSFLRCQMASSMKHKIKTRKSNEGECCYSKALSSNPKRKTALSVDNLGLGRLLPLEF
jgi:hypothetical protein